MAGDTSYSAAYYNARESWRDWRIEAKELVKLAGVVQGERVLEVGCGSGGLLNILLHQGATPTGIDLLFPALEQARRRPKSGECIQLVNAGEEPGLPFCSDWFDAVIAQHLVEHLPHFDIALQEWRRVLKSGGRISIATPNALYPDPSHFQDAAHERIFSPDELAAIVLDAGFRVDSISTAFPFFSRTRAMRAIGVWTFRVFQNLPYFATHGRTILLSGRADK